MKRYQYLLGVLAVVFASVACVVNPQQFFSEPVQEIQQEFQEEILQEDQETESTFSVPEENVVEGDLVALYNAVNPGVVSISAQTENGGGLGTGFIWNKEGHVVTNYHVVRDATDLAVAFPSGFKTRAEVIGSDSDTDLAVLELNKLPGVLVVLNQGDGQELQVGQTVIAIGNPQGLNGTMTRGIVSALGRTMQSMHMAPGGGSFSTGNIIQTDAAINPGNSGGPLLNLRGEVVGINSAISTNNIDFMGQPVNSGLGFAINIDTAKNVVPDLIQTGVHDSPYVGIQVLNEVSLFLQEELDLPQSTGVYILEVSPGSPADKAGLIGAEPGEIVPKGGDLIISIDDQPVNNFDDFMGYLLTYKKPGDEVVLEVLRGEEVLEVSLTLEKRPNN